MTGLNEGQGTSVTVTTNRTDYESGSASVNGQAMVEIPDADHPLRTRRGGPDPAPVLLQPALRAVAIARGE